MKDLLIEDSGNGNATITPQTARAKKATKNEVLEGSQSNIHDIYSWAVACGLTIESKISLQPTTRSIKYQPIFDTNLGGGFENIDQVIENSNKNLEHLRAIDTAAKKFGGLLHRFFYVGVADGRAYYQITKVTKTKTTVELVSGICLDEYADQILGEKSTIETIKAEQLVKSRQALEDLFSKKK
jgi:hypothetical protein